MTFTIQKKDLIYGVVIFVLIAALSVGFMAYKVGAQESDEASEKQDDVVELSNASNGIPTGETNIPHLDCDAQTLYTALPTSNQYKLDAEYSHSFMKDGFQTQDINGDNLPDYIFTDHEKTISGNSITAITSSCTYLNNGSGWSRAYICYAKTRSDITTGIIDIAEYKGDCADSIEE